MGATRASNLAGRVYYSTGLTQSAPATLFPVYGSPGRNSAYDETVNIAASKFGESTINLTDHRITHFRLFLVVRKFVGSRGHSDQVGHVAPDVDAMASNL